MATADVIINHVEYYDVPSVVLNTVGGGTAEFTLGGGDTGMNVQAYMGMDYVRASSYTATDVTLTVAKSGTYNISWMGLTSSYGQCPELTNISLNAGDVLVVRARSRNSSYYMYVGNLIIKQTA